MTPKGDKPNGLNSCKKPVIPFRYFVMFLAFLASSNEFGSRCIINVAILAMVNSPSSVSTKSYDYIASNHPEQSQTNRTVETQSKPIRWNQHDQGMILSAYFVTYTLCQIIVGSLTDKFNRVRLLAVSQLVASLCTLITPFAAQTGITYLIAVRLILGAVHATTFPTLYALIDCWFSTSEVSFAQGLVETGADFGTAVTISFTAWISHRNILGGWPTAFYFLGIFNLIYTFVWLIAVTQEPQSNQFLSLYEKKHLASVVVNKQQPSKSQKSIPWLLIFTSLPLWSITITKGITGLAYHTINSKIPVYMESVLNYKLEDNGLINALFYIACISSELTSGPLAKLIINKLWLPRTVTRKLFQSIALSGIGLNLLIISFAGDRPILIVTCLVFSMFSYGFVVGGDVAIIPEMAPGLIGTAFGLANTLVCMGGFIAPAFMGAILGDEPESQSKWVLSFRILAALQVVALILFNLLATSEPQPWGDYNSRLSDDLEVNDKSNHLKSHQVKTICTNVQF